MDPQEKLEAMFCPRLDSALIASIYHDIGDFKACIPILSTLAAAAPPTSSSSSSSPSSTAVIASTAQLAPSLTNASANHNTQKQAPIATGISGSKNNKASASNDKNILNWSEEVANSNAITTTNGSRSNGRIKQGQIINASTQYQYHGPTAVHTAPLATGATTTTTTTTKPTFKAMRNPLYKKNHNIVEQTQELVQAFEDGVNEVEDDEQDEAVEEFSALQQQQASPPPPQNQQQGQKKKKKNRRQKKSATTDLSTSATPRMTWKKDEAQLEEQLTGLIISDGQLQGKQEYEMIAHEERQHTTIDDRSDVRNGRDTIKTEELEFLKSCFPDREHSDEYLAQVLRDCKRDLEAAVETILSQMFLENEQVETSSTGSGSLYSSGSQAASSSSTGASSLDDSFFQGVAKAKKKSKTGGGAWGARPPATWDGQNDALLSTVERQDEFLIPESNEWATFEHQISILMNIFHVVPQKTIVSEFHANGTNLFRTVDSLEKRLRAENHHGSAAGRERHSHFDVALAQLMEMFPEHSAIGLKKMLVYSGGNLQDAMNAVLAADIARAEQNEDRHLPSSTSSSSSKRAAMVPFKADIRFADKNAAPTPSNSGNRLRSLPSTNNPFPGGPRPFPNTLLDNANTELYNDEDDAAWCRQQAQEVLEQRNELFRKAAKAYQQAKGKGVGMGGIAAYYADEGKKLDAQGKQWHMRAARAIVQQHRLESSDPNLVDLHGLTIAEAQTVVKEAVTQWFSRATMQASRIAAKPLKIVCGVGSHSQNKIARLYPTILSLLMKDGWRCEAENGVILVKGVARIMPSSSKR